MGYLFSDPKFWLLISFIIFLVLMIKPFKSMMIGGLDSKIEEIKQNIDKSLESFTQAEEKLKIAEEQTIDLSNKVDEIISNAKSQADSISKNIIEKTNQTIKSKVSCHETFPRHHHHRYNYHHLHHRQSVNKIKSFMP